MLRPAMRSVVSISPVAQAAPDLAPERTRIATPAKPKTKRKKKTAKPKPKAKAAKPPPKIEEAGATAHAPPYRVMLLGDDEYDEIHVIKSLRDVVDEFRVDQNRAMKCFEEAQLEDQALITIVDKDEAEKIVHRLTHAVPTIYVTATEDKSGNPDGEGE